MPAGEPFEAIEPELGAPWRGRARGDRYHRGKQLETRCVRERLERIEAPPNVPYDFGPFTSVG